MPPKERPEEVGEEQALTLIRITVVGGKQSGKTSLINAFVNNYCPTVYTETTDPVLYYKTLHLGRAHRRGEATSAPALVDGVVGSQLNEMFPVLVEIEDTYASERRDGRDSYGLPREIGHFLNVFRTQKEQDRRERILGGVAKGTDIDLHAEGAVLGAHVREAGKYNPVTLNRMGFIVVFDLTDASSLEEGMEVHRKLQANMKERTHHLEPVVFIVGTKSDKAADSNESIKTRAYEYARQNRLKFCEVSATKLHAVKLVFREVIAEIQDRPGLWRVKAATNYALAIPEPAAATWGWSASGLAEGAAEAPPRRTAALTEVVQGATESCQAPCKMQ